MDCNKDEAMQAKEISVKKFTEKDIATAAPFPQKLDCFWTLCVRCKIQYEFFRIYLNTTLRCPSCRLPFTATELPIPPTILSSLWPENHPLRNIQSAGLGGRSVQSLSDELKRGFEEGQEAPRKQNASRRKSGSSKKAGPGAVCGLTGGGNDDWSRRRHMVAGATTSRKLSQGIGMDTSPGCQKICSGLSHSEFRNMIMAKARREIRQKLTEWKNAG